MATSTIEKGVTAQYEYICSTNVAAYTTFNLPSGRKMSDYSFLMVLNQNANGTAAYNPVMIPISFFKTLTTNGNPLSIWFPEASGRTNILVKYVSETSLELYMSNSDKLASVYGVF